MTLTTIPPPMKWAVLGTGFIAAKVLQYGIRRAGDIVHAVGSRTLSKAQCFASQHSIPKAYASYIEAIQDPEVQAVYIALPSYLHYEYTLKAARLGKHVLCEKPVAPKSEEVIEMIDVCRKEGVVFLDGTFWKHHPRAKAIKAVLDSGDLGLVNSVNSHFSFPNLNAPASAIRVNPETEPTGVLGDMAWYTVRFGLFAYGFEVPEKVSGTIVRRHPETGAPTTFIGQLLFAGERSAIFEASFHQHGSQRSAITGTKGQLTLDDTFLPWKGIPNPADPPSTFVAPPADTFQVSFKRGHWEDREISMKLRDAGIGQGGDSDENCIEEELMVRDFGRCVRGDVNWEGWAKETIVIHKVLDALWESANKGSAVVSLE
ncbi:hypothetical protein HDU76_010562 [Blyttiomyces sp. JEL0837]|nr:hypothetical protein HDU76_010562 [Blyttiomyces sp. JEL0837]